MKQKLFNHIFILCSLVLFSNSLNAQLITHAGKKEMTPAANYSETAINPKIQTALTRNFKDAAALTCYNIENNTMVRFTEGNMLHRILFAPNGKQLYHISYAEAIDLPLSVVKKIKDYDGRLSVQRGIKVEQNNSSVWIVYAEMNKKLFAVRIEDGELQLFEVTNGDYVFNTSAPQ